MFYYLGSPKLMGQLIAMAGLLVAVAQPATAQSIQGTATYRERIALPPAGNPSIRFDIAVDLARIFPDRRYVVRARILVEDRLMFTTDSSYPVLTEGHDR